MPATISQAPILSAPIVFATNPATRRFSPAVDPHAADLRLAYLLREKMPVSWSETGAGQRRSEAMRDEVPGLPFLVRKIHRKRDWIMEGHCRKCRSGTWLGSVLCRLPIVAAGFHLAVRPVGR